MGFNSVVLVLNDSLHEIEKDPGFGKNMVRAIHEFYGRDRPRQEVRAGSYSNAGCVIASAHADETHVVLAGGNHGIVLGRVHNGGRFLERQDQYHVLKEVLDQLGYRVVHKPGTHVVDRVASIPTKTKQDRITELEQQLKTAHAEIAQLAAELHEARRVQT